MTIALVEYRPWAAREALRPRLAGEPATALVVESNGSAGCYGGWELVYPPGQLGQHFLFRVKVKWQDLADGFECVSAEAKWENEAGGMVDWSPIRNWQLAGDWLVLEGMLANRAGAARLVIKLLLRWSATGTVTWAEPQLTYADPPEPRRVRLGAASLPWPRDGATLATNRDRFVNITRQAAKEGVQILCLPEVIFSWGVTGGDGGRESLAVELPGPFTEPFAEIAREFGMAICFSALEKNGELIHNTAVLINEHGDIAAKYRKVHLAVPSEQWSGITPGRDFPVAAVTSARALVGMNICMDSSAVESARIPARKGAEIILLPIMGDHRADRWTRGRPQFDYERWQLIQRMRAMDNHVYLVAARNNGVGSGVFAPDGTILAIDGGDRTIVWADVDLNDLKHTWTGATFKDVCWFERREAAYGPLCGELQPVLSAQRKEPGHDA